MALNMALWSLYHVGIVIGYGIWPQFLVHWVRKDWPPMKVELLPKQF